METTERIVESYCRYVKRWFTMPNIKCDGQYEIDLLAVQFIGAKSPTLYHIESGISISSGFSKLNDLPFSESILKTRVGAAKMRRTIGYFIERKFGPAQVHDKIAEYGFQPDLVRRIIVTWGWDDAAEATAEQQGIELWSFPDLLTNLACECAKGRTYFTDDTLRTLQLFMRSKKIRLVAADDDLR